MSQGGYKIRNPEGIYFITFAVVQWADVFTKREYRDIAVESLRYCQREKGLILYSWCIMSNHLHLIIAARANYPANLLRDFKSYTSRKIIRSIIDNKEESRKAWLLELFKTEGTANSRNETYQFWQQDNHPKELVSEKFSKQKLEYIHNNPVKAGIVEEAEKYIYSSAKNYYYGKQCGLLEIAFL